MPPARRGPAPAFGRSDLGFFVRAPFTYLTQRRPLVPLSMASWLLEASSSCSPGCSCLPMSAVLAAGRVASVGAQSPVSSGVYPCLALRPCSTEVARTINQSAAKNHQRQGRTPRAVRHQFGQRSGGKSTQRERGWCEFRRSPEHECRKWYQTYPKYSWQSNW
jgi:hypothetical protein